VSKEESDKLDYPVVVKSEGIPPSQYGTKGLVGDKLTEIEEKYDLTKAPEGFGVIGASGESVVEEKEEGEGEEEETEEEGGEEAGGAEEEN
jgi:hypothetical protein